MLRDVGLPAEYAKGLEGLLVKAQENDRLSIDLEVKQKLVRTAELEAEAPEGAIGNGGVSARGIVGVAPRSSTIWPAAGLARQSWRQSRKSPAWSDPSPQRSNHPRISAPTSSFG